MSILPSLQVGIKQGLVTGMSLGGLNFVLFGAYAVSLFYGANRVAAGAMTGGSVLAVMMAALVGSFSLGQVKGLTQATICESCLLVVCMPALCKSNILHLFPLLPFLTPSGAFTAVQGHDLLPAMVGGITAASSGGRCSLLS